MIKLTFKSILMFIASFSLLSCQSTSYNTDDKRASLYPDTYILNGDAAEKKIALTFDDGPSVYTKKIIQKLNSYNIKATFFMVGYKIIDNKPFVKEIHNQGHLVANHSWDHTNANTYSSPELYWQEQVAPTSQLITEITGIKTPLFRPPYGSLLENQLPKFIENNTRIIIWSIDTNDWNDETNTALNVAEKATTQAHNGGIILMHDGGGNRQGTLDALDDIIKHYQQLNYEFVTVNEMLP